MKKTTYILLVTVIAILAIGRIIYVNSGKKRIETQYPIGKIELEKDVIKIYVSENAKLSDIVNLDIFKGLRPDMSTQEIVATVGKPQDTSVRFDSEFLVYYTNQGRIETGVSSGILANDETYNTGMCMFYRQNFSKNFLFKDAITHYVPDDISDKQIGVFIENKCDFVINVSSKDENWIQWSINHQQFNDSIR